MPELFWDASNQLISLSDDTAAYCDAHQLPGFYDYNKLIALAGGLKICSYRYSHLSVLIVGGQEHFFRELISNIAEFEKFSVDCYYTSPYGLTDKLIDRVHAIVFVLDFCTDAVRTWVPDLAKALHVGGLLYFTNFADASRFDSVLSREALVSRFRQYGLVLADESYYACFLKNGDGIFFGEPDQAIDIENQDRFFHIVGHARSGSSVLFQLANDQSDILVTYEANFFLRKIDTIL